MSAIRKKVYQVGSTFVSLVESETLFTLRIRGDVHPFELLSKGLSRSLCNKLTMVDEYPESQVWVYQVDDDISITIAELKDRVRALNHPALIYIGSVMVEQESNRYQLYTGNLFIQLHERYRAKQCLRCLQRWGMKIKKKLNFADNTYFIEPLDNSQLDAFAWSNELMSKDEVAHCQPELVIRRKSFARGRENRVAHIPDIERSWIGEKVGLPAAWRQSKGAGIKICIIDDGIDPNHPAFSRSNKIVAAKDMLDDSNETAAHQFGSEYHGTACASVASSGDYRAYGAAPESELVVVRSKSLGSILEAEAIYWAVEQGADIISCSWGPSDGDIDDPNDDLPSHRLPMHTKLAIQYAANHGRNGKGCLIVFAAGNGNEAVKLDSYASNPNVLAIGAITKDDRLAAYSDRGEPLFCVYPSSAISKTEQGYKTTYGVTVADRLGIEGYTDGDYFSLFGGTSASAPGVAGVAALALSIDPSLTAIQLKQILKRSCIKVGSRHLYDAAGYSQHYGWGLLHAAKATENTIQHKFNTSRSNTMNNTVNGYALHIGINITDPNVYDNFPTLSGCVNDADALAKITAREGFDTTMLTDVDATRDRIKREISRLANSADAGDLVVITFACHGSYVPNEFGDEPTDEVIVTYDGFLIDDEIRELILRFKQGVRVVWISDCCHSDTNTRAALASVAPGMVARSLDPAKARAVFEKNRVYYEQQQQAVLPSRSEQAQASVLCLYACLEDQFAQESGGRGAFTQRIEEIYQSDNLISRDEIENQIKKPLSASQNPNYEFYGGDKSLFDRGVFKVNQYAIEHGSQPSEPAQNPPVDDAPRDQAEDTVIIVGTANDQLEMLDGSRDSGEDSTGARVVDSELQIATNKYAKPWDAAYQALYALQNPGQVEFVEPDVVSDIYEFPHNNTNDRSRGGEFLKSYPNAYNKKYLGKIKHPFIWHLDERYSQLRPAFDDIIKDLEQTEFDHEERKQFPLICHIDTGIIPNHPVLPVHFDQEKSRKITRWGEKESVVDKDSKIPRIENQGHGQGTISILAGGKIDLEQTTDKFKGYYGGFPYARVMTVKISESVVLLSGNRFARAVRHAIKQGADVISMSMAGAPSRSMLNTINEAYEAGVVVVTAAGNSWVKGGKKLLPKKTMYPARFNRVIGVTGATLDHRPYLVEENKDWETRDVGGETMQTCYGPESASQSNIAGYTPNVQWATDPETGELFNKSGGGTSSATPQVAAAAAMWLYHHRAELDRLLGGARDWRRTEMVRQALFRSADTSQTQYNTVFGQGLLKAREALNVSPGELFPTIENHQVQPDRLGLFVIDNIVKQLFGRGRSQRTDSDDAKRKELTQDMLQTELAQLCYSDPLFYEFDQGTSIETMASAIVHSDKASDTLKNLVKDNLTVAMPFEHRSTNYAQDDVYIASQLPTESNDSYHIRTEGCGFTLLERPRNKSSDDVYSEYLVTIVPSQARSSGKPVINISPPEDAKAPALLIEIDDATGEETLRWILPHQTSSGDNRSANEISTDFRLELELEEGQRGLISGVKRLVLKVFRTVRDKPLSDRPGLIVGNIAGGQLDWEKRTAEVDRAVKSQAKTLLLVHGTFSSAEVGFSDLLANADFLKWVETNYGERILAFNMSTIRSSVKTNSNELAKTLRALFGKSFNSKLAVIAHSRGCLVARSALAANTPMVLVAGTHLGTPMADGVHLGAFINRVSNLANITFGPTVFSAFLTGMSRVVRWIGKADGIEDQAPDSRLLKSLKKNKPLSPAQLVIGADYEPSARILRQLSDQAVDRAVFGNAQNDGVTPLKSALVQDDDPAPKVTKFAYPLNDVNHFNFFANPMVISSIKRHL